VNLGVTAGFFDMHYGHRVIDDERTIDQYGHKGSIRFISLDTMVSNGFESWAWDGSAQHGGWANGSKIVQVRTAYAEGPLNAWHLVNDPVRRQRNDQRVARESDLDAQKASRTPIAFFPGLQGRLQRQGRDRLLEKLRAQGLEGTRLQVAFMAAYERAIYESSIFAHEGRHAIDDRIGIEKDPPVWEFRAKLSQVIFAPDPRFALEGILDANIGDATPHGKANERIMKGLLEWMTAHKTEIKGLDSARALLPQFDLLTDDQIRAAFASMDPLAVNASPKR
jgi:hypothetical protein